MIIFSYPIIGHRRFDRIIRAYYIRDTWYFSDCYYEANDPITSTHAGGMLYSARGSQIINRSWILNHHHPHVEESMEAAKQCFGPVFSKELNIMQLGAFPSIYLFDEPIQTAHEDAFFSLFANSTLDVKTRYKNLIDVGDIDTLYRLFLAERGHILYHKTFLDLTNQVVLSGMSIADKLAHRIKAIYHPTIDCDAFTMMGILATCWVDIVSVGGRYIEVSATIYTDRFIRYTDVIDLYPLITIAHHQEREDYHDCQF